MSGPLELLQQQAAATLRNKAAYQAGRLAAQQQLQGQDQQSGLLQPGNGVVPATPAGSLADGFQLRDLGAWLGKGLTGALWLLDIGNKYVTRPVAGALAKADIDPRILLPWKNPTSPLMAPIGRRLSPRLSENLTPEQMAAVREADSFTAAYRAALEGDPWNQLAIDAIYDPLNLAGFGLAGRVGKAAGLSDDAVRTLNIADDLVNRAQALPVQWGVIKPAKGVGKLIGKVAPDALKLTPESQLLKAAAKRGAVAELLRAAGISADEVTGSLVKQTADDLVTEAAQAADLSDFLKGLDAYDVARIWDHPTAETALKVAARKELTERGLVTVTKEAGRTTFEPTARLAAHLNLDDTLLAHAMGPSDQAVAHQMLDAFALASHLDNPTRFPTLDDAYQVIRIAPDFNADEAAHALHQVWTYTLSDDAMQRELARIRPAESIERLLTLTREANPDLEKWYAHSAEMLYHAGFDYSPAFTPEQIQRILEAPEAQRVLERFQLDPQEVAARLSRTTKIDALLAYIGAGSMQEAPDANLWRAFRAYRAALETGDIRSAFRYRVQAEKAYLKLFDPEGFLEYRYLEEARGLRVAKRTGTSLVKPEGFRHTIDAPQVSGVADKMENYTRAFRDEFDAVARYYRDLHEGLAPQEAAARLHAARQTFWAYTNDKWNKTGFMDPRLLIEPEQVRAAAAGPPEEWVAAWKARQADKLRVPLAQVPEPTQADWLAEALPLGNTEGVVDLPNLGNAPAAWAAIDETAYNRYWPFLTGRPSPITGRVLDAVSVHAPEWAERLANPSDLQARLWALFMVENRLAGEFFRDLAADPERLARFASLSDEAMREAFADELWQRLEDTVTSGRIHELLRETGSLAEAMAKAPTREVDPAGAYRAIQSQVMGGGFRWGDGTVVPYRTNDTILAIDHIIEGDWRFLAQMRAAIRRMRGSFIPLGEQGPYLIRLTPSADVTTLPHELSHLFRQVASRQTKESIQTTLGAIPASSRAGEEAFAEGMEHLLRTADHADPAFRELLATYQRLADAVYVTGEPGGRLSASLRQQLLDELAGAVPPQVGAEVVTEVPQRLDQLDPDVLARILNHRADLPPGGSGITPNRVSEILGAPQSRGVLTNVHPYELPAIEALADVRVVGEQMVDIGGRQAPVYTIEFTAKRPNVLYQTIPELAEHYRQQAEYLRHFMPGSSEGGRSAQVAAQTGQWADLHRFSDVEAAPPQRYTALPGISQEERAHPIIQQFLAEPEGQMPVRTRQELDLLQKVAETELADYGPAPDGSGVQVMVQYRPKSEVASLVLPTPSAQARALIDAPDTAILTAEKAGLDEATNAARNARLLDDIRQLGGEAVPVLGHYDDAGIVEHSFAVRGLTREQAVALGSKYGQESIIWSGDGLVYTTGPHAGHVVPKTGISLNGPEELYYSELLTSDGPVKFAYILDDAAWPAEAPAPARAQELVGSGAYRELAGTADVEAVTRYREQMAPLVNRYLRGEDFAHAGPDGAAIRAEAEDLVRRLDAALAEAPPVTEDVTLWRGAAGDLAADELGTLSGATLADRRYIAATTDRLAAEADAAAQRSGMLLRLDVPAGSRALPMGETELLLPRNATWQVAGVESVTLTGHGAPRTVPVLHLRLAPEATPPDRLLQAATRGEIPVELDAASADPRMVWVTRRGQRVLSDEALHTLAAGETRRSVDEVVAELERTYRHPMTVADARLGLRDLDGSVPREALEQATAGMDPAARQEVVARLHRDGFFAQDAARLTAAPEPARLPRPEPDVTFTPPLARASVAEVVEQIGGEIRAAPEQIQATTRLLEGLTDQNPEHLQAASLWYPKLRPYVEAMLSASDEAAQMRAFRQFADATNQTWAAFGVRLPRVQRFIDTALPPNRRIPRMAGGFGRSSYGAPLPDEVVEIAQDLARRPEFQTWQRTFAAAEAEVREVAARYGVEITDFTTMRDIAKLATMAEGPDREVVERFLKLGDLVDDRLTFRQLYAAGAMDAYVRSAAKEFGVDLTKKPPAKLIRHLKLLRRGWTEQALFTPRYLAQNLQDMTFKTVTLGYMPMVGESAFTKAARWGIPVPIQVANPRSLSSVGGLSRGLEEFAGRASDTATEQLLPGALGRTLGRGVRWNRDVMNLLESVYRSWAWGGEMLARLADVHPQLLDEARRVLPEDVAETVVRRLEALGTDISADDVARIVRSAGGDPGAARQLSAVWQRGLLDASEAGIQAANHVHFDFLDERNIEKILHVRDWAPFHFWATRNLPYYTQTLAQHPWLLRLWASFYELSEEEREEAGLTRRFRQTLPLGGADPVLELLLGPGTAYFNPLVVMSIADQMKPQAEEQDATLLGRALEFAGRLGLRPAPWVDIPLTALGVYGPDAEPFGALRHSALIRDVTGALTGHPIDPDAPVRALVRRLQGRPAPRSEQRVLGIPISGSPYTDYAISKRLAELSLEETGQPNHPAYVQAMADPTSPLYQRAAAEVQRAQLGMTLYGLTSAIPMKWLPDTEAAIRQRNAEIRQLTGTDLTPEQRKVLNQMLAATDDLATGYWKTTSDPVVAQLHAGMAAGEGYMGNAYGRLARAQAQSQYPLLQQYYAWLETLPPGADRSPAAFARFLSSR